MATKEKIQKIARVVLASFHFILLAPIIDLITYGREGFQITYLQPRDHDNLTHLVQRFFTYFGELDVSRGISIGIRVEIIIILSVCLTYLIYKNKNKFKNIFSVFLIYSFIFLSFSTPFIADSFLNLFNIDYLYDDLHFIRYHLLTFLLFFSILIYLTKRKYFKEIVGDIRPYRTTHFLMMFFLGFVVGLTQTSIDWTQDLLFTLILTTISIIFAWLFSVVVNNITDRKIDKITNKDRPLVKGSIPKRTYKMIALFLFILTIIYSLAAGYKTLFILILFMGNYFFYSVPPIRLKKIPVLSKVPIVFNSLLLMMLGLSFVEEPFALSFMIPIFFFTIFLLALNFIDIKDYEGDKKEGIKTLPVLLGLEKAKLLIGTFFALAVFSSYFFIEEFISLTPTLSTILILILGSVGVVEFYLINRKDYQETPVFITYLILVFLLTYILFIL